MEAGVNWRVREKTEKQNTHNISNRQNRKNPNYHIELSPVAYETNAKTDTGYGDVSKSTEPAKPAPRDSSTLRTIPRMRVLP